MVRRILAGLLGAVALPSAALATIGPPIAYGSGNTIYLVNPDGTGLRAVYTGPRKSSITDLDLHPSGGELAFVENRVLKVLNYDSRGVAVGQARSVAFPCPTILDADYGPDGSLVVKDGCFPNHLWRVAPGASSSDPMALVSESNTLGDVRWSRDGSRIYYEASDGLRALDVASGTSAVIYPDHTMWDVADTGDRLILASSNFNYFVHDVASGGDANGCTQASGVHYGNNDSEMVYRSPTKNSSSYIMVTNSDCSGSPFRLTGKAGSYVGPDWAAP